jgi:hypothetical protein
MQGGLAQVLKTVLPLVSFAFIYVQPGAVQLFFCTGSLLGLCQTSLLQNAVLRSWLGLLPLPPKVVGPSGLTAPGGLKTWQDPNANQTLESPTGEPKNVSVVDRYVDAAKGRYTNMKETVLGKADDRAATRKKDNFVSKAEKYEITRRQQVEWERENRNKIKTTGRSNSKTGKDIIDELLEEDEDRNVPITSKGKKRRSTEVRR